MSEQKMHHKTSLHWGNSGWKWEELQGAEEGAASFRKQHCSTTGF